MAAATVESSSAAAAYHDAVATVDRERPARTTSHRSLSDH